MQGYAVTPEAADAFAKAGKLAAQQVAFFDANGKPIKEKK
jgi:hypothetical protein